MGLAFGCVFVLTLLLIADIVCCLLVSVCVLATLVSDCELPVYSPMPGVSRIAQG